MGVTGFPSMRASSEEMKDQRPILYSSRAEEYM